MRVPDLPQEYNTPFTHIQYSHTPKFKYQPPLPLIHNAKSHNSYDRFNRARYVIQRSGKCGSRDKSIRDFISDRGAR